MKTILHHWLSVAEIKKMESFEKWLDPRNGVDQSDSLKASLKVHIL